MFTICILVLAQFAFNTWRDGSRHLAYAAILLALIFLANVLYVATSRTYLVIIPALFVAFGYRQFGWKGAIALVIGCAVLAMAAWKRHRDRNGKNVRHCCEPLPALGRPEPVHGPTGSGRRGRDNR